MLPRENRAVTGTGTDAVFDTEQVGGRQLLVFALCGLAALFEGFDQQAIGYAAPLIGREMHMTRASLAPVFSAGQVGIVAGALLTAPYADRFGPRRMLLLAMVAIALCSGLTAAATSLPALVSVRMLVGFGAGAALPSLVTLASGYAPRRLRGRLVTLLWVGVPLGGTVAGWLSALLMANHGWRSVFYIGAAGPLVLGASLMALVPESLARTRRGPDGARRVADTLRTMLGREVPIPADIGSSTTASRPGRVADLFATGQRATTLILWLAFFIAYGCMVSMVTWSTTLLDAMGVAQPIAALITSWWGIGGIVGCAVAGALVDRFGALRVIPMALAAGSVAVGGIGYAAAPSVPGALSFAGGVGVAGAIASFVALAVLTYARRRSTM